MAFARAERTKILADEAIRSDERYSRAEATADFQSAVHESQVYAMNPLAVGLPQADGQIHGIAVGYAYGDLTFLADWWNGTGHDGNYTITGSFVYHDSAGGGAAGTGDVNYGVATEFVSGTGYILYSVASVHTRFTVNPPFEDNSDNVIAVRYNSGNWQYTDGGGWYNFTPTAGDVLIAAIDLDYHTIADLGGGIAWARFQKERAEVEAWTWDATVKSEYLTWQAGVNSANAAYALTRADKYLQAAQQSAGIEFDYQQAAAIRTQSHVATLADLQTTFALDLAELTATYRGALAQAHHNFARQNALEVLTDDPEPTSWTDRAAALADADEAYADGYVGLDHARRQDMAQAAYDFVGDTAALYQTQADLLAGVQDGFTTTVNAAYYTVSEGTDGLEEKLAELAHDFNVLQSQALVDNLSDLVSSNSTPFSELALAEAEARDTEVAQPLAALEQTQRESLAASENTYRGALNVADRTQWMSQVGADRMRATLGAASTLGFAANVPPAFDENTDLPTDLAPPVVDMGEITLVYSDYYVTQPGSIGDWDDGYGHWGGWYNGWGYRTVWGDFETAGNYWYGDGWGSAYGYDFGFGQYGYGWGYGAYWGGWYGGWYGGWGYYPGYYGWNGWYAGYVPAPTALGGDYEIDVDGELADHEATLNAARGTVTTLQSIATAIGDVARPYIDAATAVTKFAAAAGAAALTIGLTAEVDAPPAPAAAPELPINDDSNLQWITQAKMEDLVKKNLARKVDHFGATYAVITTVLGNQIRTFVYKLDVNPAKGGLFPFQKVPPEWSLAASYFRAPTRFDDEQIGVGGILARVDTAEEAARLVKETVDQAFRGAKQNLLNVASFAIQVLPVTGTADAIARGDYVDASISFVGDVTFGLGVVGRVAKGAKAAAALKGAQAVNAIKQAQQMTVRLVAIEKSIVVVRFGQSGYAAMQGEDGKAAAYLGEAVLRIFGIKYILKPAKGIDPRVFTEIVDDYVSRLPRRNTPTKTPANLYEIKHTGPINYTVSGGGEKFDMDGYRGTTILDAKHVGKPKISPFIPGSDIEDK